MERTRPSRAARRAPARALARGLWRTLLALLYMVVFSLVVLVLAGAVVYHLYLRDLVGGLDQLPALLGRHRPAETTNIYARDGETLLFELVDPQSGRRTVVPFDQMPQTLKNATIAVEDASFYRNPGIDLRGIIRALVQNQQSDGVVGGGSTITQQLVRNVLLSPEERVEISFQRKVREAFLAYRVSREYSKDQILALYLNEVYYGNQSYGVEAAAESYFGKSVSELNDAEATLIAGLPQSPTNYNPLVNLEAAKARQRITLDLMAQFGFLTQEQANAIYATPITFARPETGNYAPHFVNYVRQLLEERYGPEALYRGGLRVTTSIDLYWQSEAERIVREKVAELRQRNATNAGVIMLGPGNQILAMVGSANFDDPTIDGQVNVTVSPRQPGSALKPVVYATALQRGWTPATVIWDVQTTFATADGKGYTPMNYDNSFHGPMRLRMALANSLNIPAVKAIEYTGVEAFVEQAHAMGITTLNDPTSYVLPLALGAGEVKLLDAANVYSTFRNAGRFRDTVAVLSVTNSRGQVLERAAPVEGKPVLGTSSDQVAYQITSILSDNQARWFMFGRGNVMELDNGRPAAVKTGTSNDYRDSWAVGYTPDIVVGVWVGNSDNTPMQEVAGSNGAGTIWRAVMEAYHAGRPIRQFPQPPGIVARDICADTGSLATVACGATLTEYFIGGTEPTTGTVQLVTVQVAGDGNCLPASYTPPAEIRSRTFTVYPPEFRAEAERSGIAQPPTAYCPPPRDPDFAVARIDDPVASAVISGTTVFVEGVAKGAYVLDYGAGSEPASWTAITTGVNGNGLLGIWGLGDLAAGEYVVRLRVTTSDGVAVEARQRVQLQR